jgi:hypothetical protein
LPLRRVLTASLVVILSAACGSSTSPADEPFQLVSINGAPLPGPYPDPYCCAVLEVTAGSLTLRADGTAQSTLDRRCRATLPAGTTCQVTVARETGQGRYSRADGYVELGSSRFAATFEPDRVTVDVADPTSSGLTPMFRLEYRAP